jgi:hypothetical protein
VIVFRVLAALYALLCLIALLFVPASIYGWFGVAQDPLGGVFAILLALPWSAALGHLPTLGTAATMVLLIAAMALNILILLGIGRLAARWRPKL